MQKIIPTTQFLTHLALMLVLLLQVIAVDPLVSLQHHVEVVTQLFAHCCPPLPCQCYRCHKLSQMHSARSKLNEQMSTKVIVQPPWAIHTWPTVDKTAQHQLDKNFDSTQWEHYYQVNEAQNLDGLRNCVVCRETWRERQFATSGANSHSRPVMWHWSWDNVDPKK